MKILTRLALVIAGLILLFYCTSPKPPATSLITVVDIGHVDRLELGRMLRVIKSHSPKIIGLDFFLVPDSLDKDSILVKELHSASNVVQVVGLHSSTEIYNDWDSLEVSHQKFNVSEHGFDGLTADDSVFIPEQPLAQLYNGETINAFSYVVAKKSFRVKDQYKKVNYEEVDLPLDLEGHYRLIRHDELLSKTFSKADLEGKIVLMGYMGDDGDFYYVDKSHTRKINGMEIHAAIINELIHEN
jgi:CHASE2 domain-containing sensor protein